MVETLRSEPFDTIVASHGGASAGKRFAVPGLQALDGDVDQTVGEILLPEVEVRDGVWQLREDAQRPELGMPRDLNGDSIVDDEDHSADYFQIPVCVRATWKGRNGPARYELYALLVAYRR